MEDIAESRRMSDSVFSDASGAVDPTKKKESNNTPRISIQSSSVDGGGIRVISCSPGGENQNAEYR